MPRTKRKKGPEFIHHIVCRSISEIYLFRNANDKIKYLSLIKKYATKFRCSILGYCLMDTHVHLHFDPLGADISRFMHCLNLSYARYYNLKYKRHGHVFQGRFGNKLITTDAYNLAVSSYIHNNPKAIPEYRGRVDQYPFSSFGIYLGAQEDTLALTNVDFVLEYFSKDKTTARKLYHDFVLASDDSKINMKVDPAEMFSYEYRSERKILIRDIKPQQVITQVAKFFDIDNPDFIKLKNVRKTAEFRAVCVFFMRSVCNMSYKEICDIIGNITASGVARLANRGLALMSKRDDYQTFLSCIMSDQLVG